MITKSCWRERVCAVCGDPAPTEARSKIDKKIRSLCRPCKAEGAEVTGVVLEGISSGAWQRLSQLSKDSIVVLVDDNYEPASSLSTSLVPVPDYEEIEEDFDDLPNGDDTVEEDARYMAQRIIECNLEAAQVQFAAKQKPVGFFRRFLSVFGGSQ